MFYSIALFSFNIFEINFTAPESCHFFRAACTLYYGYKFGILSNIYAMEVQIHVHLFVLKQKESLSKRYSNLPRVVKMLVNALDAQDGYLVMHVFSCKRKKSILLRMLNCTRCACKRKCMCVYVCSVLVEGDFMINIPLERFGVPCYLSARVYHQQHSKKQNPLAALFEFN